LEANLLGFEGNLYGANVAVSFVEWLRPSRVFSSLEELESVVLGNIDWVRQNLGDRARKLDA
jgi:riboflavin kinase/FMN adenylyltransferase